MKSSSTRSSPRRPLLRRAEQLAVAGCVLAGLVMVGVYWLALVLPGRAIEIDRAAPRPAQFWVDINQADWPELMQLPGVGEVMARRIVENRAAAGPFADVESLRRVPGIGPKTLETVRPFIKPLAPAADVAGK